MQHWELHMFKLINAERETRKLAPLIMDYGVGHMCYKFSIEQSKFNDVFHEHPITGHDVAFRMQFYLPHTNYDILTENVGSTDYPKYQVDRLHNFFMKSKDGHRENVLMPNITHVGIGIHLKHKTTYCTQVFLKKRVKFNSSNLIMSIMRKRNAVGLRNTLFTDNAPIFKNALHQITSWNMENISDDKMHKLRMDILNCLQPKYRHRLEVFTFLNFSIEDIMREIYILNTLINLFHVCDRSIDSNNQIFIIVASYATQKKNRLWI